MIDPTIILMCSYGLAVLIVGLYAGARGLFCPTVVVIGLWLLGIALQLGLGKDAGGHWMQPVWAYLLADTMAAAWFIHCRERWPVLFGLTFAAQVVLHAAVLMGWAGLAPVAYYAAHWASAFVQLGVLAGWAALRHRPIPL